MSCSQTSDVAADLEGPLVDHAEAHVLEHRHALRQRDRAAVAPDLEADAGLAVFVARKKSTPSGRSGVSASMSWMSSTATSGA